MAGTSAHDRSLTCLQIAANEADLLIDHLASSTHRALPPEITRVLISTKAKIQSAQPLTPNEETNFWLAYSAIAQLCDPATVEGIVFSQSISTRASWSLTYPTVKLQVFAALLISVLLQAYSAVGTTLITNFDERYNRIWEQASNGNQEDSPQQTRLRSESENLLASIAAWNTIWRWPTTLFDDPTPDENADTPNSADAVDANPIQEARIAVFVLQGYMLPLLLGWLGAGVNALRQINEEEKLKSITFKKVPGYRVRMLLGAIGGSTIGLLISSNNEVNGSLMVSPLAMAFLVGYNIEVFFAVIDRFIRHVKDTFSNEPKPDVKPDPERAPIGIADRTDQGQASGHPKSPVQSASASTSVLSTTPPPKTASPPPG